MKTIYYFSKRYASKIKNLLCVFALCLLCNLTSAQYITTYTAARTSVTYATLTGATQLCTGAAGCPDGVFTISLPWTFVFNGTGYTTAYMSQNGFITFGAAPAGNAYTPLSTTMAGVTGVIAAHGMNNAVTTATHIMRHKNNGTSYSFEWIRAGTGGAFTGTHADYMITLFQTTNIIEVWYRTPAAYPENANLAGQVGLRGALTSEFINLTTLTAAPGYGGVNTATASWGVANYTTVNNGKYTWTPPSFCTPPNTLATSMNFTGLTTSSVQLNWTNGNGAARVVVAHATTAVSANPTNGTDYTAGANSVFGSGTNLGTSNFIVYAGTGSSVNVTGLTGGTTYFFSVYEGSATFCYTTGLSGSQSIPACLSYPTTDATAMVFSNILNNAMTLSFTRGNGSNVLVVARLTATARVAPTFNTSYTPNTIFGSGNTTGAGNFVVLDGTANTVSVTGLANFTAYTFDVYEYNASPNCYSPSPLIAGTSTLDGTTSGGCSATVVRSTAAGQYTAVTPSTYLTITGAMNSNYTGNPIGFNFVYNGVTFTSFGLNTNGYIWFGTGSPLGTATNPISNASANLGGTGTIDGIVSALGTFLTSSCVYPTIAPARSEIGYLVTGVAPDRVLTIQWRGYAAATTNCGGLCEAVSFTDISRLDFQIKLHEDGGANSDKIVFAYWDQNPVCIDAAAFSAQVGLRGATNATFTNRTGGGNASWALNAGVVNTSVCTNGASNFISGNVSLTFTQAITTGPTINGFVSGGSASNSCPATDVLLTAGSGFTSYQWFFNGSIIAGPGSNSSTYTATATGAYTVVGKNGTCYAQSNAFSVTINSCGVAPAITTCGSSTPQGNDPGLCSAIVNYTAATATGSPTPTITYSQNSGTSFPVGTTTVTVTASNGISPDAICSFTVTVIDNENPTANCPTDIIQGNDVGFCSAVVSYSATASDNCAGATILCTPPSGSTFSIGITTVNCTATDANNNTSSCSFTITVNDTENPVAICPAGIQQSNDPGFCSAAVTYSSLATDNCPGVSIACLPATLTFPVGVSTVTCTATDAAGNTNTCSFTVTIFDTENPTANCPANITTCNPLVTYSATASDNCTGASISCSPVSGSTFAAGLTTVNCTATDASSNTGSCSFSVDVQTISTAASSATSNALYGQICIGGNLTLTANGGSLGTGASWVWYEGGCGTGASVGSGSPLTITPALGNHNYFVRAEGACGNTACVSVAVSVISAPPSNTIGITSAPADGCVGAPAQTVSVNNVANCTFYNWSSSQTGVRFNGFPSPYQTSVPSVSVTYVSLPAAGSSGWSICVFGGNVCGNTNTVCTWIRATINRPNPISGSVIGCANTSASYSCNNVNAASYQWSITGNATITGNGSRTITVNFGSGFTTGTLCVHSQTSCGYNSADVCMNVSSLTAIPGSISGNGNVCPNSSSVFNIAPVPGATSYIWTCSVAGSVVTNNGTSCSILFPAVVPGGSSVCVSSLGPCGTPGATRCKGVASGIPTTPGVISGPNVGQCGVTGVSYSINPVNGATGYLWNANNGATISGPNNLSGVTIDFPPSFTTVNLTVASTNLCGSSNLRSLSVSGLPGLPAAITGANNVCNGAVELYNTAGSIGATGYNWTVPLNASILGGQGSSSLIVQWGATGGNVTVRGTNLCGNSGILNYPVIVTCRLADVTRTMIGGAAVFPNPSTGKINVRFNSDISDDILIKAMDMTGRVMFTGSLNAMEGINIHELDLSSLSKGVYMIHLNGKEINEILKVVVE